MADRASTRAPSAPEEAPASSGDPPKSPPGRTLPPLWLKWVLTLVVFTAGGSASVIVFRNGMKASAPSTSVEVEANREGRLALAHDQAAHAAPLQRGAAPRRSLERAIVADTRSRVRHGELSGPVRRARCRTAGRTASGRRPFRCTASVGGVRYPFLGTVDLPARRLTWCKRDPPPTAADDVPVSRRCRA